MADDIRVGPPPLPENHGKPLAPVSPAERIASLDVLRGFALLGVLIANMLLFSQPLEEGGVRSGLWLSPADRVADWISLLLVDGKFYPLLSFLFGLGFSVQMDRAASRGLDFRAAYLRRLFILAGFGLAHGILLWNGDVLLPYALCGFVLLLFHERKTVTILVWAAVFILLPALLILAGGVLISMAGDDPKTMAFPGEAASDGYGHRHELTSAYVTGGYADAVSHRLRELLSTITTTLIFSTAYLGMFLIGMLAGRKRIITGLSGRRRLLVRVLLVCGVVGLAGNVLGACTLTDGYIKAHYGLMLIGGGLNSMFGPVLTAAYIAGIVLLIQRKPSLPILQPVASVGRMALTNYLMQSLIATTIFYGYGLGLGGNVGKLGTVGIALLIFAAQILFSVLWLGFFRYGPAEWLWRSLTYGVRQPMVREQPSAITPPP
jgi:uncharacterized protein